MDYRSATASRTPALRQRPSTEVHRALIAGLLTLPNDTPWSQRRRALRPSIARPSEEFPMGALAASSNPHPSSLVAALGEPLPRAGNNYSPRDFTRQKMITPQFGGPFMKSTALAACVVTLLSIVPALSQNAPPGNPTNTGFMAQQPGDRLASRLVGLNIQNTADENIGEIYDIILTDAGAVKAYIVSVGGFLGMGTRYVAIDPKAVALARQDEKNWKATMNANKDQLKAAPEYKYESEWRKR
jgi:hypothetical protein